MMVFKVQKKQKRILLAMGWYDHRLCRGIAKYAEEVSWHLCADMTNEKEIPWGWQGDGILAWLGAGDDLAEFVMQAKLPTVDFSFRRPRLPLPRVLSDNASAARLAAEYFLAHGLRKYMFYSAKENWAIDEVGRVFAKIIKAAGHDCSWIRWHQSSAYTTGHFQWKDKQRWLAKELLQAPKPLALLAATDDHALEVIETCDSLGLAVPEQVSVIGRDNSLLAVEAMHTPISSIDLNLEQTGYAGARLLHQLMQHKPAPTEPIRIPPAGLIARKSSDLLAVGHPGVARSLRFMWENYHKPIGVEDLVEVAAMSRSALHQAFLEHIGRPPGKELHRIRIENAKRMLMQSKMNLETLTRLCGYQNARNFWLAFKQATGVSPKEFQKQFYI